MKIVYIAPSVIPSRSANSVHVMKMCQALSRCGHQVKLIARRGGDEYGDMTVEDIFDFYGIKTRFELCRFKISIIRGAETLTTLKLLPLLKQLPNKNTVIYSRMLYGAVLATLLRFKVIYETHELPLNTFRGKLERWLYKNANLSKLVVISDSLKRLYNENVLNGCLGPAVYVAHDGADIPSYDDQQNCPNCRNKYPKAFLHAGYFGHLYKGRGIEVILAMAKKTPQYAYHFFGGNEKEIAYWKKTNRDNVTFYGHVEPGVVKYYMREMDVLLMPYQQTVQIDSTNRDTASWMSPMKMFEYMASRKPIISSDLPVLREVLSHGVNALLVDPADIDGWINAMNSIQSASSRETLANKAFEELKRSFTWEQRAEKILAGVM